MRVSVNPTYYCNFRCSFCYLTNAQLGDHLIIGNDVLAKCLDEIAQHEEITGIDLYGGEIGTLPMQTYRNLKETIRNYYKGPINIITNFSRIHEGFHDDDVTISVSYDFDARQAHKSVWNNMLAFPRELSILILASKNLIQKDVSEMIQQLNMLRNLIAVEIKPYSTNQANQDDITFREYEEFVKKWIEYPDKHFEFVNEFLIEDSLAKASNSFSDDHIYITPRGKFGVLEFDKDDNEFFLELNTFEEYQKWAFKEKVRVAANSFCGSCEYFGNCLSEHLREVKDLDNSCNGFKGLLDWYKNERMEN